MGFVNVNIKAKAVVLSNEGKWLSGVIKKHSFIPYFEITGIEGVETIEQVKDYLTLRQYLRLQGRRDGLAKDILDELDAEKIFILPKSVDKNSNVINLSPITGKSLCSSCEHKCNTHGTYIYNCSSYTQR